MAQVANLQDCLSTILQFGYMHESDPAMPFEHFSAWSNIVLTFLQAARIEVRSMGFSHKLSVAHFLRSFVSWKNDAPHILL